MDLGGIELLHAIPGRVRLRVPEMKGNPELAGAIQNQLAGIKLVHRVEANPVTGSVLVLYDPADTASIAALGRLAFPGLELDGLQGRAATEAGPEPDATAAEGPTEGIRGFFRDLNVRVEAATGGTDLKVLLPSALFLMGIKSLVLAKKIAAPSWYDYLWFAFGTFFTLNRATGQEADGASAKAPAGAAVHVNSTS